MKQLRVGTGNPGKMVEYEAMLGELGYSLVSVGGPEPEEDAPDLEGNARIKALAYAARAGEITLAEDAGLVVPALGGLPGVVSARFADCDLDPHSFVLRGVTASGRPREQMDAANRERLLALLAPLGDGARRAFFQVVIAVGSPDGRVLFSASGEAHGRILREPRGQGGFGYDSLFAGDDVGGRSFAEVDSSTKNSISHRRRALEKVRAWLASSPL